jgi:hypothetical protein
MKMFEVIFIRPEASRSNYGQADKFNFKGWTRECCKILRWSVIRGERLIKASDSWFSAKIILVIRMRLVF